MDSGRVIFDCCNHACFDDIVNGFDKDKLPCVEVSSLLGKVQLSAGVWQLINLCDESCFEFNPSVRSSLKSGPNGGVNSVACSVQYCPLLTIVQDDLARPELTAGCLLCMVMGVTTKEGRSNHTLSAQQAVIKKVIDLEIGRAHV